MKNAEKYTTPLLDNPNNRYRQAHAGQIIIRILMTAGVTYVLLSLLALTIILVGIITQDWESFKNSFYQTMGSVEVFLFFITPFGAGVLTVIKEIFRFILADYLNQKK
ncbi:hypothetical protein [Marinibactrum halimedae]|nr:hypothetical protein [Marinibactrum halimedae]MCD9460570.1 hypothetical protein [Marinibactrum halimedae]